MNYSVLRPQILLFTSDLVIDAETCCHLVTLNKINIYNTSCVLTCESLLLTCKLVVSYRYFVKAPETAFSYIVLKD
jgi:hypothetical protein